jgi:hypothetical protein
LRAWHSLKVVEASFVPWANQEVAKISIAEDIISRNPSTTVPRVGHLCSTKNMSAKESNNIFLAETKPINEDFTDVRMTQLSIGMARAVPCAGLAVNTST